MDGKEDEEESFGLTATYIDGARGDVDIPDLAWGNYVEPTVKIKVLRRELFRNRGIFHFPPDQQLRVHFERETWISALSDDNLLDDRRVHTEANKGRRQAQIYIRGWPSEKEMRYLHSFYDVFVKQYPHEDSQQWQDFINGWHTIEEDMSDVAGLTIEDAHIKQLKLNGLEGTCKLHGALPPMARLKYLQVLDLAGNSIDGEIPDSISECPALTQLQLQNNLLSGEIPEAIGACSQLVNIVLNNNLLRGLLPAAIGKLKRLKTLWCQNNKLSGPIPSSLGDCTELKLINLSSNELSGRWPRSIGDGLLDLQHCDASNNLLEGRIPNSMQNCKMLRTFIMHSNEDLDDLEASQKHLSEQIGARLHMKFFSDIPATDYSHIV